MNVVLITGLKKDFDKELAKTFANAGYKVFAIGEEKIEGVNLLPDNLKDAALAIQKEANPADSGLIDIYIDVSDERNPSDNFDVRKGLDGGIIRGLYDANVTRPMAMLEAFFPLLEAGQGKRLCFLTSAQACINETRGTDGYGYKMAKAGLHQFLQITRNVLAPKGYAMRAFDPMNGEISAPLSAQAAFNYFTRRRGIENTEELRDDEGNLALRDANGRHHPW
ncbi:MAG: hypothetical protein LBH16_05495 [Treponema sp.]|jgi:NAD(P)-dependent dehydrogenase (short-subunit alcohol dehydrogenase family)|nr:hypothetical protein [Treponema sp.]